jgi:hypothetical protein
MEPRSVLRLLREFGRRELREKKSDHVYIRRVKMEPTRRPGGLPDILIRRFKGVHFLVCVFSSDVMRMYYFGQSGESLGAIDFTGEEKDKIWNNVIKRTRSVASLHL